MVRDEPLPAAVGLAQRSDVLVAVPQELNHDRLDILVLYTVQAAEVWESFGYGTPRASVQAAMDFLNLVLRNNAMPVTAHLVHVAEAPYTFRLRSRPGGDQVSAWSEEVSATTGDASGACRTGEQYLCLSEGRFEIQAHWKNHLEEGVFGAATAVPIDLSDKSGMFWFFSSTNIELVVKTLDGRGINGHYWVFFGALSNVEYWVTVRDTMSGGRRTYHNPPAENCGQSDTMAFVPAGTSSASTVDGRDTDPGFDLVPVPVSLASIDLPSVSVRQESGGTCDAGETRLCLQDGRFSVEVEFVDPADMERKTGKVVNSVGTKKTGFFWFFSPTNVELAAKLLDGRAQNGKFWFLYGGLSDVEYTITLTDTVTGESKAYRNEAGSLCGGIDIEALPH